MKIKQPVVAVFRPHQGIEIRYHNTETLELCYNDEEEFFYLRDHYGSVLDSLEYVGDEFEEEIDQTVAMRMLIKTSLAGIKIKGAGMKGRSFYETADTRGITDSERNTILEKILKDHRII